MGHPALWSLIQDELRSLADLLADGNPAPLRPCKREFTVTVGTIFERSHIKPRIWFQAAHLMASSKKGISAR